MLPSDPSSTKDAFPSDALASDALAYRDLDLCAPETHESPWEMYDYLREHDPIYWDPHNELWYAFRYDDIVEISRNPVLFCSTDGNRPNLPPDPSLIHQDGAQHTKQRGLVAKGFTPRAMREIETTCEALVKELVDAFPADLEVELVEALAAPLPALLISDMVGVPRAKVPTLRQWVSVMITGGQGPQYVTDEVNEAFGHFCEHHAELVAERAGDASDRDILLRWMHAELDGERLDEDQLLFEHALLFVGGLETTRNAIAGGMEMLARSPEQWAFLRARVDDDTAIEAAVEEMIRYTTPFTNMFRTATSDTELRGKKIAAGQKIGLVYPAANRDPRVFTDPHRFDVRRDFKREKHIAFGFGPHVCLGSNLARLELRSALRTLLRRFDTVTLRPDGRHGWVRSSFVRGPEHLDLVFTRA